MTDEMTPYQDEVIKYSIVLFNAISIIGCISIIAFYAKFRDLRAFSHRMVFRIAWCDLGFAISRSITKDAVVDSVFACQLQSGLSQLFSIASSLYSVSISYVVYRVLVDYDFSPEQKLGLFDKLTWVISLFCAIVPYITSNYGLMVHWCWIKKEGDMFPSEYAGIAEQMICFYIPIVGSIIYIAFVAVKVQIRLNSLYRDSIINASSLEFVQMEQVRSSLGILKRLRLYPIALLLIFAFPLADRIHYAITNEAIFALSLMHAISNAFLGTSHALIYFTTRKVRQKIATVFYRESLPSEALYEDPLYVTSRSAIHPSINSKPNGLIINQEEQPLIQEKTATS